ncbi:site-2 protease family protein [Chloroflexota bacterium]
MDLTENDHLTSIVSHVLNIEDITTGTSDSKYLLRYRGHLYGDPMKAFDTISQKLRPLDITPMFRREAEQHIVFLIAGVVKPRPSNPLINLILFVLTVLSMIFAGALYSYQGPMPSSTAELLYTVLYSLPSGIPFAISLSAILLAHEFGHYLAGRFHRVHVTLPYFLPFPLSPFGTMGAFIQLKEPPKNKRELLDIGISGPIAGFLVAIPVLLIGLSMSELSLIVLHPGQGVQLEGNSILYLLAKYIVFGKLLPAPIDYGNIHPLLYWVRYFFTSQPLPVGGIDVFIHPVAWAGWAGLLVTALNLIPAGQLDGGHVIHTLIGKKAKLLLPFILIILILLGFSWSGWWLWAGIIFFLGRVYAEPLDQITSLDPKRKILAIVGLLIFVLVFTPVPLIQTIVGG